MKYFAISFLIMSSGIISCGTSFSSSGMRSLVPKQTEHFGCEGSMKKVSECETSERFLVGYDQEHGYYFSPDGNSDVVIAPEFLNDTVKDKLKPFFSHWNEHLYKNKSIYCQCVGVKYEKYGATFFRVYSGDVTAE